MSKELREILKRVRSLDGEDAAVIATVVDLQGSGYRLPGARMLIGRDGTVIGSVSGGCLEADILERARQVFAHQKPALVTYDTRASEDSVFSLNMGCDGVMRVLLEPLQGNTIFELVEECFAIRQPVALATVIAAKNSVHRVGDRIRCTSEGEPNMPRELIADLGCVLESERAFCRNYKTGEGEAEFFIESIRPPFNLVIFGAGFDALPLVRLAKELGWYVTVIDHRPAYADAGRLGYPDEILTLRPEELGGFLQIPREAAAVLMTHNFDHDRAILTFLLDQPIRYIGALGPKKRAERLLSEIAGFEQTIDRQRLQKFHAPIGLDIGAESPETIALSIVGEIQSVLAGRNAGFLRERKAPIYNRASTNGHPNRVNSANAI
jgi:xanthine dehydrogenase accessory factor